MKRKLNHGPLLSIEDLPIRLRHDLLDAFSEWTRRYLNEKYEGYLVTFMFNQLPENQRTKILIMKRDMELFYRNLITRVVRYPRTAPNHKLPILIALKDRPVPKWTKQSLGEVTINNGRHFHGIMLIPPSARKNWYSQLDLEKIKLNSHIRTIDIEPISSRPYYTTGYALKDIKRDAAAYDDILILPVSRSELPPYQPRESNPPRERMHW